MALSDSHSRDTFYAVSLILRHVTADDFYGPGSWARTRRPGACHSNSSQVDLRQVVSRKDCFVGAEDSAFPHQGNGPARTHQAHRAGASSIL